jgi:hypothetical protein
MPDEETKGGFKPLGPEKVEEPRVVRAGDTVAPSPEARAAHALEYIATQLDELNANLKVLITELAKTRGGTPG